METPDGNGNRRLVEVGVARVECRQSCDRGARPIRATLRSWRCTNSPVWSRELGTPDPQGPARPRIHPVAFADSSADIQGTDVEGIPVLSPDAAAQAYGETDVFVAAAWSPSRPHVFPEINRLLASRGVCRIVSFAALYWAYPDIFLPYYSIDLPHRLYEQGSDVLSAYECLSDDESRTEYRRQLTYLLSLMDVVDIPRGGDPVPTYSPPDLVVLRPDEVFIDCGAYDGDTLRWLLDATGGVFHSVIAFEPDPQALSHLEQVLAGLEQGISDRVRVLQAAVSSESGSVRFEGGGTPGSRLSAAGDLVVPAVSLDDALADVTPSFIKMDIEGAELAALRGARATIRRARPILAICVYHEQDHLYRVPLLLRNLCPEYRLYLRRQGPDGDLVCFAIPLERSVGEDG